MRRKCLCTLSLGWNTIVTVRNLTPLRFKITKHRMKIITVKRLVKKERLNRRVKFSDLTRNYFDRESIWHFALEAMLFGALALSSVWPLLFAVQAVNHLFLRT